MPPHDVKKLSIRLLPDGFSFLNQFYPILPGADYAKRLEEGLLDKISESTEIQMIGQFSIETTRFCLSPLDIDANLAQTMYETSLPKAEQDETVLSLEDNVHGVRFSFGIDRQLYLFILRNWPDITFTHPLFELYKQQAATDRHTQDCMIAEAEGKYLNLLVFKGDKLTLANRFEDCGSNNNLYYIMNCWEQCGLDVLDDKLYLRTSDKNLIHNVQQYIKQCES